MKFSESWLREWVDCKLSTQELCDHITLAGLEVDSVEPVAAEFSKVVVGHVLACDRHPNADKLSCCKVDVGDGQVLPIVCGANNVKAGLKVPAALVGAVLNNGEFKIKKSKLRGEPSEGMICSKSELGLAESSSGIMELPDDAPVGMDIRDYLACDDVIIDIDLTPNRGDCLSIQGVAREVAVLTGSQLQDATVDAVPASSDITFPVTVEARQACPRYVGRVIEGIDISQPSPLWLQEKLRRSGLRSIDAVVDVTNYVMLELGQPMHAFDLADLQGGITVRMAKADETITLLNDEDKTLTDDTLVIADEQSVLAIAGVMGGKDSGVSDKTQSIFVESAYFAADSIAGKSRHYNVFTDSCFRFERGVDFALQQTAMERATDLLLDIVGGTAGPVIEVLSEADLPKLSNITVHLAKINALLGVELNEAEVNKALQQLQLSVTQQGESWQVTPPSWRYDLRIEEDIIEEIARMIGYDKIPDVMPIMSLVGKVAQEDHFAQKQVRKSLIHQGFSEVVTYSFVDHKLQELFHFHEKAIALANPISAEMDVMRVSLWPGLLKTLMHNAARGLKTARYFEVGKCFYGEVDKAEQPNRIAGLMSGLRVPEQWAQSAEKIDFYDIKAVLEGLFTHLQCSVTFTAAQVPGLHPGQAAKIVCDDKVIGCVGALHPQIAQALKLKDTYLFELFSLDYTSQFSFTPLSKYPAVERDLAVVLADSITAAELQDAIQSVCEGSLQSCQIFDVYQGDKVQAGHKSIALRLTWQSLQETLQDDIINAQIDKIVVLLADKFSAKLRD